MTDTNDLPEASGIGDLSSMIEKLKEHPEIVSSVAGALGLGAAAPPAVPTDAAAASSIPDILSTIAPLMSSKEEHGQCDDNRLALLIALKPYLSPQRCEIIDLIIKFSQMGDLLKKFK